MAWTEATFGVRAWTEQWRIDMETGWGDPWGFEWGLHLNPIHAMTEATFGLRTWTES